MTAKDANPYLSFDDDIKDDFGFSFASEDEIVAPVTDEVADLKKRLEAVRKIYMPLLENLAKNSDQPIIRWPNRGPMLKQQMDKLESLTAPAFAK